MIEQESQARLRAEIDRIVSDAKMSGDTLRTGLHAGRLALMYSESNYSIGRIIEEIVVAAAEAGVPVEVGRTKV